MADSAAKFDARLALNQSELKDDILLRCQKAPTMVPDKINQSIFPFNIPRYEFSGGTVGTEQSHEPLVQRNVDALGTRGQFSGEGRLPGSNWTFD
ncbi:hypothetical protein Jab_2c10920 [Janthinobacterium sp. HH01]|nr:hypothetical protein Jab_2c10920 [Janthinobacterium sp. HH01]